MSDYNGWTNYATWRVNLEIFDGFDISDFFDKKPEIYDAMSWLKEHVEEIVACDAKEGIALDYAMAFLSDVNWHEIAKHLIENAYESEAA